MIAACASILAGVHAQARCDDSSCSSAEDSSLLQLATSAAPREHSAEAYPDTALQQGSSSSAAVKPTSALVDEVYTYGAPATKWPPFRNAAAANGCFDGLRVYNEDARGVITKVDAAAMNNNKPHAATNTLVLRKKGDSLFVPCSGGQHLGRPDWPRRGVGIFHSWRIHPSKVYRQRLRKLTIDGRDVTSRGVFRSAILYLALASRAAYETTAPHIKQMVQRYMPGWRLVGLEMYKNRVDSDMVVLAQEPKSKDCALAFTGTDSVMELGTSLEAYGTGYCGFTGVHAGYRNELWTLTNHQSYRNGIKPKLAHCKRVICTGHSLGGAVCEVFAGCANSGNITDPDFKLLAWERKTPEAMPELHA